MTSGFVVDERLAQLSDAFPHWEKTKDLIDNLLDVTLNYRQSGHPGGSRSKVHALVTLLLSGAMRWDIRQPREAFRRSLRAGGRAHDPADLLHHVDPG